MKIPLKVWCGGPAAVAGYLGVTWLMENDPDHWLLRCLEGLADRISRWMRR